MLKWALIFLAIALVAGLFGFTRVAGASALVSKVLFVLFLVLFLIFILFGSVIV